MPQVELDRYVCCRRGLAVEGLHQHDRLIGTPVDHVDLDKMQVIRRVVDDGHVFEVVAEREYRPTARRSVVLDLCLGVAAVAGDAVGQESHVCIAVIGRAHVIVAAGDEPVLAERHRQCGIVPDLDVVQLDDPAALVNDEQRVALGAAEHGHVGIPQDIAALMQFAATRAREVQDRRGHRGLDEERLTQRDGALRDRAVVDGVVRVETRFAQAGGISRAHRDEQDRVGIDRAVELDVTFGKGVLRRNQGDGDLRGVAGDVHAALACLHVGTAIGSDPRVAADQVDGRVGRDLEVGARERRDQTEEDRAVGL